MKDDVERQFKEVFSVSAIREVIECASKELGLNAEDVFMGMLRYDGDLGQYDNTVYEDLKVRLALHLKYFIKGSYHSIRQQFLTDMLRSNVGAKSVVDIGYGAPGLYVRDYVLNNSAINLTLLDKFENAEKSARALLKCSYPDSSWERQVSFKKFDLDDTASPGTFDSYILFDSIEHAKDPTKSLQALISGAGVRSRFCFSLPVGVMESLVSSYDPLHFIEWKTRQDAIEWLKSFGFSVITEREVRPTSVDKWAERIDFYNLLIEAEISQAL